MIAAYVAIIAQPREFKYRKWETLFISNDTVITMEPK